MICKFMNLQTVSKVFAVLPFVFQAGLEMCVSGNEFWSCMVCWGYKLGASSCFASP